MSVKAILACKLYKASPRKDAIKAALADPINVELVQQLRRYLDDEYKQPMPPMEDDGTPSESDEGLESGGGSSGGAPSSGGSSGGGGSYSGGGGGMSGAPGSGEVYEDDGADGFNESGDGLDEPAPEDEPADTDTDSETDADASKKIKGITITAASAIPTELKGTLNVRQDTAGVERVALKDNELWVYYNDKINLNNVMTPVIELLNAAAYSYLTFNRLARSENAIVFELSILDTEAEVNPVEPTKEEKEKK